jgi:hypothetical protein
MSCQRRLGPHQNVDSKNAESYEKDKMFGVLIVFEILMVKFH